MKSSTLVIGIIGALGIFLFFLLLSAPTGNIESARKAQAKNDAVQIATAITAFDTEYDRMPPLPSDGLVEGELLDTLVGSNQALNPRKIVFIEINSSKTKNKSGLSNGVFVDPWGGPYHVAMATATNTSVIAGTNNVEVRKKVATWNDPRQHTDTSWFGPPKKDRRYVTSWE